MENIYEEIATVRGTVETLRAEVMAAQELHRAEIRTELDGYRTDHSAWRAAQDAADSADTATVAAVEAADAATVAAVAAVEAADAAEPEPDPEPDGVEDLDHEPHPDDAMVPPEVPAKPEPEPEPEDRGWADRYAKPRRRG